MEDIRNYPVEEDDAQRTMSDEDRIEYTAQAEEEVPFHVPRD